MLKCFASHPSCRRASSPRGSSGLRACRSFFPFPPKGACGTTGRKAAPAASVCGNIRTSRLPFGLAGGGSAHRRRTMRRTGPRKQVFACVPHAMVLSACNSQRRHALGALTECLASPHCWVLRPPTPSAGHRPFTTSQVTRHRHASRTKGPQTRRVRRIPLRAGDETGTPLDRSRTTTIYFGNGETVNLRKAEI